MPICAKAVMIDGHLALVLDPAVQDLSTCPYIVEDGATNAWRELGSMTTENAVVISTQVCVLWAAAWGIKQIARLITSINPERET